MPKEESSIIIYNSVDGRASVVLYARDGSVWMNQNQLAELFDTSIPNISMHIANVLLDGELKQDSVIKNYLTTAADGKQYNVTFYSLDMILAIGFRVRSKRGTQFRIWANQERVRLATSRWRSMWLLSTTGSMPVAKPSLPLKQTNRIGKCSMLQTTKH
ncbi:MAG: virulence RhuM family protein [Paludibacteraceae bacterium]|nr:virulence RhuM family protein [Paludibacteraceae bacterium]